VKLLQKFESKKLIHPPKWLISNLQYLTIMGSESYGVSSDSSDKDLYGFCIPPKDEVFPHLAGEIEGFGKQKKKFWQWQEHHIIDEDTNKEYDFTVYSIVKYFQLCMDNNPNMVDSLFTPPNMVLFSTSVGQMVRDSRKLFLHKGCWHKFKGYAYAQLHKMKIKNQDGKRKELVDKYGYDVKFAYHVVRLLLEVEMILSEHDLDLQRHNEQLKSIRRGEWKLEDVEKFFNDKERGLETLYNESTLPYKPDEEKIKDLLLNCLEHHYGSLDRVIVRQDKEIIALRKINEILSSL
jgi:predicted nucleotidyltransferase